MADFPPVYTKRLEFNFLFFCYNLSYTRNMGICPAVVQLVVWLSGFNWAVQWHLRSPLLMTASGVSIQEYDLIEKMYVHWLLNVAILLGIKHSNIGLPFVAHTKTCLPWKPHYASNQLECCLHRRLTNQLYGSYPIIMQGFTYTHLLCKVHTQIIVHCQILVFT